MCSNISPTEIITLSARTYRINSGSVHRLIHRICGQRIPAPPVTARPLPENKFFSDTIDAPDASSPPPASKTGPTSHPPPRPTGEASRHRSGSDLVHFWATLDPCCTPPLKFPVGASGWRRCVDCDGYPVEFFQHMQFSRQDRAENSGVGGVAEF